MSNRSAHDTATWTQGLPWDLPLAGKRRPGILRWGARRMFTHLFKIDPMWIARTKGLSRKTRSEREEAIAYVLGVYWDHTDLVSKRIGILYPNGRMAGLSYKWLADQSNGRFSLSRIERAGADLKAIGLIDVMRVSHEVVDVGIRGLASMRVWTEKAINMLGGSFMRAWTRERFKASRRAIAAGRHYLERATHIHMCEEKLRRQSATVHRVVQRCFEITGRLMSWKSGVEFLKDYERKHNGPDSPIPPINDTS